MWNAVAALLDNQTVTSKPGSVPSQPVSPPPAMTARPDEIVWDMPAPLPAPLPAPDAPPSAFVAAASATGGAQEAVPTTPAEPPLFDRDPYAPPPAAPAGQAVPPQGAGAPQGPTVSRDGQTIPAEPGVGPQLLPMPDPSLTTPGPAWAPPPAFLPRVPGSPFTMPVGLDFNSVSIRGLSDGIAIQIGHGVWEDLLNLLSYRLEQSAGFFKNGHIAIELGNRALTEPDLGALRQVMASYGMEPSLVRTSAERTFYAAVALGLSVVQTAADGTPVTEAHRAAADQTAQGYFIYRGSLRSGQILYRPEHVIVVGDVNPGAEVVSDGDVLVWGRLRGIAHAGARGNTQSIISALDLDPVQLRIDTVIAAAQAGATGSGPRWGTARSQARRPEIARLSEGRLLIEPWDEPKSAGMSLFKRRRN